MRTGVVEVAKDSKDASPSGRGAGFNPPNQYERLHYVEEKMDDSVETTVYRDRSETILAENDSPDVPFTYSVNPYRGCEHGCIYCYARPTHEYLGFSAGVDFESKIMVKENAPDLLAEAFEKKSWEPQTVCLSGNTDPYQPIEQHLELTRECLKVFLKYRNPVSVITKNHRITRDLDVLGELADRDLVHVRVSVTSLDREIIRKMEPRTARPEKRLDAIEALADRGVSVGINAAPIVPGLTDEELPSLLEAGAEAGADHAAYIMVRLPGAVKELFIDWLEREFPDRKKKVLNQIRSVREGELSETEFGKRMKGEGQLGIIIDQMYEKTCDRLGLNQSPIDLLTDQFRPSPEQRQLF
jgi:DNA repair photolyase